MGLTTQNEYEVLGSTDEAELQKSNKYAVLLMLQNYNNQFEQGYSYWGLNSAFSVPMVEGVDYDVVAPAFWTNSLTGPLISTAIGLAVPIVLMYRRIHEVTGFNRQGLRRSIPLSKGVIVAS